MDKYLTHFCKNRVIFDYSETYHDDMKLFLDVFDRNTYYKRSHIIHDFQMINNHCILCYQHQNYPTFEDDFDPNNLTIIKLMICEHCNSVLTGYKISLWKRILFCTDNSWGFGATRQYTNNALYNPTRPTDNSDYYDCKVIIIDKMKQHVDHLKISQIYVPNRGVILSTLNHHSITTFAERFKKVTMLTFIMAQKDTTSLINMLCNDVIMHVLRLIY